MASEKKAVARLLVRERLFVHALLGKAEGNGRAAARLAGYHRPEKAAFRLMRRPRVLEAIDREMQDVLAQPDAPTKAKLVNHLWAIARNPEENPFAVIKSCEALAKILGWNAPTRQINENVAAGEHGSYRALVETLRGHRDDFSVEQRSALRKELLDDLAAIQEALALLAEGSHH